MSGLYERRLLRVERGFGVLEKLWAMPWIFILMLCALAGVGYVALYSAGGGNPAIYASKHAIRFAFGLILMVCIALVDIRVIAKLSWLGYAFGLGLLVLVMLHGQVGKGAQRWIDIGPIQLQPSELMKILLVLALASWFHRASWERMGNLFFLVPPAIAVLVPMALILKQPNLGTALITGAIGLAIFWASGARWYLFALLFAAIGTAAPIAYDHLHDYQKARITTFLDPESDPLGAGYNIIQSKIALGSGGLWGKGFLQGTQGHLNFLPEKQTDFIFTMIAEEFGFFGAIATLGLLALIVVFAFLVAIRCRHQYGRLVAIGLGTNFFLYVFINIAMVTGSIPVGGVPLPLISHGGSAMITAMVGFGLLASVWVHRDAEFAAAKE
ncbi:Rod shape-determining protein rodA [Roseomonas mucosa]|uniref:Peptidoglycan glycosyltransferase MrdB n=1 Tax=Roseomonas mucosa TaxID=207340 RepID=A0A1S8DAN4_9PROT|nr:MULTISPECIES: rod shape-determining protein RodA [Roseomonas]MBS5901595.1 rod shape-determining protein RodA [Acetobacteraceae bacterium]ATR19948.1 rod shape-determining protein RodA [Roseomonas sp. FDAARGOS_362]AWV23613.1 Rod shape-determining protein rodA [Roseomonas mucosa]MCG7352804.1 rod shape-determining protein RodA [Roseomonas mucosa]MCG7355925.1 rod shape-determining protein RodA [Roseomonas mucosa]